jgi:5-formyltetrahydrofolate cyclo-ligase
MNKPEIRAMLRTRRRAFVAAHHRAALDEAVAARVMPRLGEAAIVAGYAAIGGEVDPLPILRAAVAGGRIVALPHVEDGTMRFLRWQPGDELVAGPHGLRQPHADAPEVMPDLILTPLIGFDRNMARLGQGAGYYDRAFAQLPDARRIGLAWSVQEETHLPVDPWDVALHGIATEREWIEPA